MPRQSLLQFPKSPLFVCCLFVVLSSSVGPPSAMMALDPIPATPKHAQLLQIQIEPESVRLSAPRASQQLLVTGHFADGTARDMTRDCQWTVLHPELLTISPHGRIHGRSNGTTRIDIRLDGLTVPVSVSLENVGKQQPISFRHEVMPVLSAAGCSDIRCHGAPSGKSGFRLSLWGSDAEVDHQQLTRDFFGRRTDSQSPDHSLILLKALARISHVGGKRFAADSSYALLLSRWQSEGLADDPQALKVRSLVISPEGRVLHAPAHKQQLAVRATFEDGSTEDVTGLTSFSSTDLGIAAVSETGLVEFTQQGEVAILCRYAGVLSSARLMHIAACPDYYRWPEPPESNYVDAHIFSKLRLLNIAPSELCSDDQFVRRVYLDLCGALPSPEETREFVVSSDPQKRAMLIDRLLQQPEFADYWTKKWMDILRVSRDSIQLVGAQAYHQWLRQKIQQDESVAKVVEDLLTSQGESYRDPATNFYCVAPMPAEISDVHFLQKDLAESTAQLFLGIRLQCAQCHNHPFERWTQNDYLGLAAFFTQVKRNRLGKAGPKGRPDRRQMAIELDPYAGEITRTENGDVIAPALPGEFDSNWWAPPPDRRQLLADWLIDSGNPYFAKAVVNRIWFHLFGRGIVEPVDDFRDSNPSVNDPLLDALSQDLAENGYRLKTIIRTIVNSRTYQLDSKPNKSNRHDTKYFSHIYARPLGAEVLLDAICGVTGVPETFEIMKDYIEGIPTESVKLAAGTRAVQLPVNDVVTLINTEGRYVRYEAHAFMRTFGQPNRTQTCECDREQQFGRKQALELTVGSMVASRLSQSDNRLGALLAQETPAEPMLQELFLLALSRKPSPETALALLDHVASSEDKRQAWEDVLWTILNSQEFVYQH